MSYSCSDFTDTILDALNIEVPEGIKDSPFDQARLALARIVELQRAEKVMVTEITNTILTAVRQVRYPVRKFLDLSTRHLTPETRKWMCGQSLSAMGDHPKNWVAPTPYGWFVYADEENGSGDIPADLFACMTKARELDCEYILFDYDGSIDEKVADLPVYDEETA